MLIPVLYLICINFGLLALSAMQSEPPYRPFWLRNGLVLSVSVILAAMKKFVGVVVRLGLVCEVSSAQFIHLGWADLRIISWL